MVKAQEKSVQVCLICLSVPVLSCLCPVFVLLCTVVVSVSNTHEAVLAVNLCRAKIHQDRMLRPLMSRRGTVMLLKSMMPLGMLLQMRLTLRVENLQFKNPYVTGSACMFQPDCLNVV